MNYPRFARPVLAVSLLLGLQLFSLADSQVLAVSRDDFKINTDPGKTEQNHPRIALRPGGGFVVVWTDYRFGQPDIYTQVFDAAGLASGVNRKLNTDTTASVQIDPVVGMSADGRTQTFWTDYRQYGYPFDPDIICQTLATNGDLSGNNRFVTTENPDSLKASPDVAINPITGEIIVVWEDYRNLHWDIYAQVLASDGTPVGGNRRVNDDLGSAQQHAPRIDCSPNGWYVIVWYDNRETSDDIFAQIFRPDHSRIQANAKVNSGGLSAKQAYPDVACDATGRFAVAWVDWRDGVYPADPNIYSRRFDTNLAALTGDTRLNSDVSFRAQRDVCISADPRGNVAVVWSDSTDKQWDLTGQMLSTDGKVQEQNFVGHLLRDSSQLRPDIALDGRSRYTVWVDNRNGNWDIYGRIVEYNTPKLLATPVAFQFERETGMGLPGSQKLVIEHQGYNPINYRIDGIPSWLRINSTANSFVGLSPDTLTLAIVDTGLTSGTYGGLLRCLDLDNADSSIVVSVTYRVGAPIVKLSADTLYFTSVPHLTRDLSQSVDISNVSVGQLHWTSSSSENWCTLVPSAGNSVGSFQCVVNTENLDTGLYSAQVVVTSTNSTPSSDTLSVVCSVVLKSYIELSPDTVALVQSTLDTTDFLFVVRNLGVDSLHWNASSTVSWISLADNEGGEGDTVRARINGFNLSPGIYSGWIIATDSTSLNQSDSALVQMTVHYPGQDTLFLSDLSIGIGQSGSVSLVYHATDSVVGFDFPLLFPEQAIHFDSVKWLLPDWSILPFYDSATGGFAVAATAPDLLSPGIHELARIYLTGGLVDTTCRLNVDPAHQRPLRAVRKNGDSVAVQLSGGSVTVQTSTDVGDDEILPGSCFLSQNYPNPFNPTTTIQFGLAARSLVRLTLFNLLGQAVINLIDEELAEGVHEILFNSNSPSLSLASGIYFVRLSASPTLSLTDQGETFQQAIKLLLLK